MPSTKSSSSKSSSTKESSKKKESKEEVKKTPLPASEEAPETETVEKVKKPRRVVSVDGVVKDFDALQVKIDDQIQKLRKVDNTKPVSRGPTGIRFLRSVNSALKRLRSDSKRLMTTKQRIKRKGNTES